MNEKGIIERVCILGIDALEYDLVEKWDLENLLQKEYGKTDLEGFDKIYTPPIWASFITGVMPEDHGLREGGKWESSWVESIRNFLRKIGLKKMHQGTGLGKFLRKIGFGMESKKSGDLNSNTFFDYFDSTVALDVIGYQGRGMDDELRSDIGGLQEKLVKSIGKMEAKQRVKGKLEESFSEKKDKILNEIQSSWKIFMAYFYFLDPLQHMFYYDERYIKKIYKELDEFVGKVKSAVDDQTLFLIISDHGQKEGEHTDYGFYSLNKELGLENPHITDFYDIILEELGAPTKEDEERIKEHLEELGYMD